MPRGARSPGLARGCNRSRSDSPTKPTGGEFGAAPKWPQDGAKLNDADGAGKDSTKERTTGAASGARGARPDVASARAAEGLRPAPARLRGDGGVQQAAGDFRRGDPKGGGTLNENGRRAVAPSERTK